MSAQTVMPTVLALLIVGLFALLWSWHRGTNNSFNLRDLVTDKGTQRASLGKFGQFIALAFSTWILVHETLLGRLSEWLFTSYMLAWAGAQAVSLAFSAYGGRHPSHQQPHAPSKPHQPESTA